MTETSTPVVEESSNNSEEIFKLLRYRLFKMDPPEMAELRVYSQEGLEFLAQEENLKEVAENFDEALPKVRQMLAMLNLMGEAVYEFDRPDD